jgi:hypothetical protein
MATESVTAIIADGYGSIEALERRQIDRPAVGDGPPRASTTTVVELISRSPPEHEPGHDDRPVPDRADLIPSRVRYQAIARSQAIRNAHQRR